MKNKKGFTLIELLAVIVVLAIIALIAVPLVLRIVEKAKEGAAKDSAYAYIKAVETYVVRSELKKEKIKLNRNEKYNCTKDTIIGEETYKPINDLIKIKGSKASGSKDYIMLGDKKTVIEAQLTISGYLIIIKEGKIISVEKGESIEVTNIELNYSSQTIGIGDNLKLEVIFTPNNATNKKVEWKTSNESVATVDEEGKITGISGGEAVITATTSNGKTAKCTVTVLATKEGVENQTYSKGTTITYQGIDFKVVKDNGDTVTLVTDGDVGEGEFGSSTTFKDSTVYNYINTTWVNANSGIKNQISSGGIVKDSTTDSYVRLLTKDEVATSLSSTSGRAFWTMTASGSSIYYATSGGSTSYRYVDDYDLSSSSTLASPSSTSVRVDDSIASGYRRCGLISWCQFDCYIECNNRTDTCESDCLNKRVLVKTRTSDNYSSVGYRPVITVVKN